MAGHLGLFLAYMGDDIAFSARKISLSVFCLATTVFVEAVVKHLCD